MKYLIASLTVTLLLNTLYGQSRIEDKIGESTYLSVERSMGFYKHDALLEYVSGIGRKLEAQLPDNPYEFKYFLVDTDEPNAFATAGGYVFVTRGILPILDTEDELAGVLGHEFTHVILKHSTHKMARNILPMVLEIPGNILGIVFPDIVGELVNLPIELTAHTADAAFSRRQERDADTYGIRYATEAGYDPEGLRSALLKLQEYIEDRYHMEEHFTLFLDHPLTQDRTEHLERMITSKEWPSREPTLLHDHLNGLIIGQNPEQGIVFEDHSFIHPALDLFLQLPADWRVDNSPMALNAADKSGMSGFMIGVEENFTHPDSAALAMAERLKQRYSHVELGEPYLLNGFRAIDLVVTGEDMAREGKTQMTWLEPHTPGVLLHCLGAAHSDEQFREIREIIGSIRPIRSEEKKQVVSHVLYVEQGGEESLKAFAARKGEPVLKNLELMGIINHMDPSDSVSGRQVKYIRTEPYFPE